MSAPGNIIGAPSRPLWAEILATTLVIVAPGAAFLPVVNLAVEFLAALAILDFADRGRLGPIGAAVALSAVVATLLHENVFMILLADKTVLTAGAFGAVVVLTRRQSYGWWSAAVVSAGLIALIFAFGGVSIFAAYDQLVGLMRQGALGAAGNGIYNDDALRAMKDSLDTFISVNRWLLPGWLTLSALTTLSLAWVTFPMFRRRTAESRIMVLPFLSWRMGMGAVFVVVALVAGRTLAWSVENDHIQRLFDNGLFVLGVIASAVGLAVCHYTLRRIGAAWYVKVAFYVPIILILHYGMVFLAVMGLFDSVMDFRSRLERTLSQREKSGSDIHE